MKKDKILIIHIMSCLYISLCTNVSHKNGRVYNITKRILSLFLFPTVSKPSICIYSFLDRLRKPPIMKMVSLDHIMSNQNFCLNIYVKSSSFTQERKIKNYETIFISVHSISYKLNIVMIYL